MQQVIIAIHLMVVVALVFLVLYQKSEGSALGLSQSGMFSGRGQGNALTRATGILGTIFFLTSLALTVLPAWERRVGAGDDWTKAIDSKTEVKEIKPGAGDKPGAPAQAPGSAGDAKESIFDQLQRAQQRRETAPVGEAPVTTPPAAPAPTAPAAVAPAPTPAPIPAPAAPEADKPALRGADNPNGAPDKPVEWKSPAAQPATPAAEAPKVEAPKADEPKAAAPAPETPKVEAPKVEAPKPEAPKAETPATWASPTR